MSSYNDLTVAELCKDGVKKRLQEKAPEEWTDYDCALAYIYGMSIPKGKMPKELLINSLCTADRYTALSLLKRPEVNDYREEAVNLFIDRYCSNWVNQYLSGNRLRPCTDFSVESKRSLLWTIYKWVFNHDIQITWNNIAKVLVICDNMDKNDAMRILEYMSNVNNEPIPNDIMNIVSRMSDI